MPKDKIHDVSFIRQKEQLSRPVMPPNHKQTLLKNLAAFPMTLDPKVMKDRLFQTLVLQTCSALVELNRISSPWIIVWKPFLQSLVDAVAVVAGAYALDLLGAFVL
jgi:hypothetical protein